MKSRVFDLIDIDGYSAIPKYLQLANSIVSAIEVGKIKKDDVLPSINELTFEFNISRPTAERGYKYLRKIGVLDSVPGKACFVKTTESTQILKVLLLFNKLSPHKKIIYDSFVETLGKHANIDFYVYNDDYALFKKLVLSKLGNYHFYAIIPHFMDGEEYAHAVINSIPKDKLILLDKRLPGVTGNYAAVYENFEKGIFYALEQLIEQLNKYHTLKIIFPEYNYFPGDILKGFFSFCKENGFRSKVVHDISEEPINSGDAYVNLMDDDLVTLVERIINLKLKVGREVGIISYSETPLKKIILNGITTISPDFNHMGTMAAQLILNNSIQQLEVPINVSLRASL